MKINKTTVLLSSILMAASMATFAFAAPYQDTSTTKTTKSKKNTTEAPAAKTTATTAPAGKATTEVKTKGGATKNATDAQIAAAKASGQVWVNTSSKVYHDSSSQYFGATKEGKFMSEKDAIAMGARKAKNEK
ncbi:MAG TPA: hypothetical protein VMT15_11575 [Bryobacteraceae bacterium]|nr:hypothetical protein [Bryobacteraceae bacterium]